MKRQTAPKSVALDIQPDGCADESRAGTGKVPTDSRRRDGEARGAGSADLTKHSQCAAFDAPRLVTLDASPRRGTTETTAAVELPGAPMDSTADVVMILYVNLRCDPLGASSRKQSALNGFSRSLERRVVSMTGTRKSRVGSAETFGWTQLERGGTQEPFGHDDGREVLAKYAERHCASIEGTAAGGGWLI